MAINTTLTSLSETINILETPTGAEIKYTNPLFRAFRIPPIVVQFDEDPSTVGTLDLTLNLQGGRDTVDLKGDLSKVFSTLTFNGGGSNDTLRSELVNTTVTFDGQGGNRDQAFISGSISSDEFLLAEVPSIGKLSLTALSTNSETQFNFDNVEQLKAYQNLYIFTR